MSIGRRKKPLRRSGFAQSNQQPPKWGERSGEAPGRETSTDRGGAVAHTGGRPSRSREGVGPTPPKRRPAKAKPIPAKLRKLVIERAEYSCDRCGRNLIGQQYSLQHRRSKGAGGRRDGYLDTAANLVVLCGSATSAGGCHEWAERRSGRTTESSQGFVIRGELDKPETVPILRHGTDWVHPTAEGWEPGQPFGSEEELAA